MNNNYQQSNYGYTQNNIPQYMPPAQNYKQDNIIRHQVSQLSNNSSLIKGGGRLLSNIADNINELMVEDGKLDQVINYQNRLEKEEEKRKKKFFIALAMFTFILLAGIAMLVIMKLINAERNRKYNDAKKIAPNPTGEKDIEIVGTDGNKYFYENKDGIIFKKDANKNILESLTDNTYDKSNIINGVGWGLIGTGAAGIVATSAIQATKDDNILYSIKGEKKVQKNAIDVNRKIKQKSIDLHGCFADVLDVNLQPMGEHVAKMIGGIVPYTLWNNFYNNQLQTNINNNEVANKIWDSYAHSLS